MWLAICHGSSRPWVQLEAQSMSVRMIVIRSACQRLSTGRLWWTLKPMW